MHQTRMDIPIKDSFLSSRQMAIKAKGGKWNPVAVRLRVVRMAVFRENSRQFAKRLGLASAQRLGNLENGFPLSIDIANKIRFAVPGMTLDWLYHGDERGMPIELVNKLRFEADKPDYKPPG